jgi:hypothetical protein
MKNAQEHEISSGGRRNRHRDGISFHGCGPDNAKIPGAACRHIMSAVQFRHSKLWTADQQKNWELAGYELELVKSSLNEAIALYTDIPVENITMVDPPIKSIESAIAARNSAAFGKAFGDLTTGCNSCHQSVRRGFIVMTVPTASPFGNQSFAPRPGQGKDAPRR